MILPSPRKAALARRRAASRFLIANEPSPNLEISMLLTRESILNSDDMKIELVAVPEWGGEVYVRTLTGRQRDTWETEFNLNTRNNTRARLVAFAACDENGKRIFEEADIIALGEKSSAALDRLFQAATNLSKVTKADIDELEKKSETSQPSDS